MKPSRRLGVFLIYQTGIIDEFIERGFLPALLTRLELPIRRATRSSRSLHPTG
jgi:hypothetical protein